MAEVIKIEQELSFKERVKARLKELGEDILTKLDEEPRLIYPFVGLVAGVVVGVGKLIAGYSPAEVASCFVSDDVTDLSFRVKKPLTNGQILELGDRMNSGQMKGQALADMGLLKKERKRK